VGSEMCIRDRTGASLSIGVDHPHYQASIDPLSAEVRAELITDFMATA